jgi:hypothetical protein
MAKKDEAGAPADAGTGITLKRHPRARRDIGLAKGWGGLAAFGLVLYLSLQAALPLSDALVRAIMGGVAGYVVAWMGAVAVWRHLVLAEMESHRRKVLAEYERREAELRGPGERAAA